jgi:hypothetical protein
LASQWQPLLGQFFDDVAKATTIAHGNGSENFEPLLSESQLIG